MRMSKSFSAFFTFFFVRLESKHRADKKNVGVNELGENYV